MKHFYLTLKKLICGFMKPKTQKEKVEHYLFYKNHGSIIKKIINK